MSVRRQEWRKILDTEVKRWQAKSTEQLISELSGDQVYELVAESKRYQVEVELLENTATYLHVIVAVDDGSLPASISPEFTSFIHEKQR